MGLEFFFSIGVSLAIFSWTAASPPSPHVNAPEKPAVSADISFPGAIVPLSVCPGSGGCDEYISRVQIGSIDQASPCAGYDDRSDLSTAVTPGQSYSLEIYNGNPIYFEDICAVWVDWNHDYSWDNFGVERCGVVSGIGPYSFIITVPPTAAPGYARMRIRLDWNNPDPQPCGATTFGEVEDYSLLVITGAISGACCDPLTGACIDDFSSGDCQDVGEQFYPGTACDALVPACGNPGACCSDVLGSCDVDVPELSCAGTRFLPGETCAAFSPPCGEQLITFVLDPGTGPPPATECGLMMMPLALDPRPLFEDVTAVATPCPAPSEITFSIPLSHRRVGLGWEWWSHGYTGDVYYTNWQDEVTLTLPGGGCALYFYVQPNAYSLETFRLMVNGAVPSEPFSIHGSAAAYVGVCGADLQTITITCTSGEDFAIGEFGLSCFCGASLCACCDEVAQECQEGVDIVACTQIPGARYVLEGACTDFDPPCGEISGACCDGESCQVQRPADCTGEYLGDGSSCVPNPCICADYVVTAPGTWEGTTCAMGDDCDMSNTPDAFYEIQIPHLGLWRIDLCNSRFQVKLGFGDTCCETAGDEQGVCGIQPYLEIELAAGNYVATIEGWTGCGIYSLSVFELDWGACCNPETGQCLDLVRPSACYATHTLHQLCADLAPPCLGPAGACCDDSSSVCTDTFLTLCTGRFAPQTACEDLVPSCGNWHSCTHRVDLYDIYGDGWTGATLDVYVGNWPVLAGITLVDGAGPAPYYFEAAAGDEISTIYHAHGEWPEEAFYVIVSGRDVVLAQDGEGSTEPTGVTVVGDCPEPCGDLDLDFDVDLYDYDLFCDSFGQCRSEQAYMERADLDQDGCVTPSDLELWQACYQQYAD